MSVDYLLSRTHCFLAQCFHKNRVYSFSFSYNAALPFLYFYFFSPIDLLGSYSCDFNMCRKNMIRLWLHLLKWRSGWSWQNQCWKLHYNTSLAKWKLNLLQGKELGWVKIQNLKLMVLCLCLNMFCLLFVLFLANYSLAIVCRFQINYSIIVMYIGLTSAL